MKKVILVCALCFAPVVACCGLGGFLAVRAPQPPPPAPPTPAEEEERVREGSREFLALVELRKTDPDGFRRGLAAWKKKYPDLVRNMEANLKRAEEDGR